MPDPNADGIYSSHDIRSQSNAPADSLMWTNIGGDTSRVNVTFHCARPFALFPTKTYLSSEMAAIRLSAVICTYGRSYEAEKSLTDGQSTDLTYEPSGR